MTPHSTNTLLQTAGSQWKFQGGSLVLMQMFKSFVKKSEPCAHNYVTNRPAINNYILLPQKFKAFSSSTSQGLEKSRDF